MCELLFYRRAWLIAFIWETERLTCSETGEWAWLTAQSPTSGVYHFVFLGLITCVFQNMQQSLRADVYLVLMSIY